MKNKNKLIWVDKKLKKFCKKYKDSSYTINTNPMRLEYEGVLEFELDFHPKKYEVSIGLSRYYKSNLRHVLRRISNERREISKYRNK